MGRHSMFANQTLVMADTFTQTFLCIVMDLGGGFSVYNFYSMKELKTYVITLSRTFPTTHPKAGEQTLFGENLRKTKLHTIRGNHELWERRFKQVEAGEACISIRQWTGRPYASKQVEIANLKKEDGIGIQTLNFYHGSTPDSLFYPTIDGKPSDSTELAHNDGLTLKDWLDWFKKSDISKPMVIIHFTGFRY